MEIIRSNHPALYQQIEKDIKEKIINKELKPGDRLIPEPELAKSYKVSRLTLRRALAELKLEGLITQIPRRGTFVSQVNECGRAPAIGVIIHRTELFTGSFFDDLLRGIEEANTKNIYSLIPIPFDEKVNNMHKKTSLVELCQSRNIWGLIIAASQVNIETLLFLKKKRIPFVLANCYYSDVNAINYIYPNYFTGAYNLTTYLIQLGHRKIVYIGGGKEHNIDRDRLGGFKKAMQDNGLKFDRSCIKLCDFTKRGKIPGVIRKAFSGNNLPTSVFAADDLIAVDIISFLLERGKDVPRDVSVAGLGDLPIASKYTPKITTIKVPRYEIGYRAFKALIEMETKKKITKVMLDTELIIRDSCGRPKIV